MRRLVLGGLIGWILVCGVLPTSAAEPAGTDDPLLNWSLWEQYRAAVTHPAASYKPADVQRAQTNIARYAWAKSYAAGVEKSARRYLDRITPEFLATMIPETTPGDALWTPCPSCRAQGKPVHPHGLWSWSLDDPEHIKCTVCGGVFPNDAHPEDVVLHTTWRKPQTISYCGGDTFVIFGYKTGRPSFSANVRARKVKWIAPYGRTLGEAYLLSGKPEFAQACRAVLLRFAECYPAWLVHVGYGEYADMDPRIAAAHINRLPQPELCPPPNKPDRRLHTGYWSAGRASGVGQESYLVRQWVDAYDFTCTAVDAAGRPIYSDADRRKIERDLLLESTILLVCDKQINNKSVGNHTAAALVGMCVGHPGLVRFGVDGFRQTVDEWFLPDGATSESPSYGLMTLGGIWDLAQAVRGYSDPPGYRDADGRRLDALDLYHGTAYQRVWECCYRGLQGDLSFPPYADCSPGARLASHFVELMAGNYPEQPQYLALLKETVAGGRQQAKPEKSLLGDDLPGSAVALYFRQPGLEQRPAPPLTLADWCPPELRIGHLRTGSDGRESLLTLSASHWGNHHHDDSLNLYYWKQGREVLTDLGYLWDHPLKHMTMRTVAHHTVVVDEKDQVSKQRGGEVLFFKAAEHVKALEAASQAYPQATLYRRTSALIDHGAGRSYVVDFFRVEGGRRQDYVYHAADKACEVLDLPLQASTEKLYDFTNVRTGDGRGVWRARWKCGDALTCTAWNVGQAGQQVLIADGWGQRDWKNTDIGATLPYIVRRGQGEGLKTFIAVYEAHPAGQPLVRNVTLVDPAGTLRVETALGQDYILSALDRGTLNVATAAGQQQFTGHFVVATIQDGKLTRTFVQEK